MNNEEKILKMSGTAYIRYLFENTGDGQLTIERHDAVYPVDWDAQAAQQVAARFEQLIGALDWIAEHHAALAEQPEALDALTAEQRAVWNTYLAPFPDHGMDKETLFDIMMKDEAGDELTESQARMLRLHRKWFTENALKRLPYECCSPADLINRAMRYEKLVSLKAPKVVVDNEARCLAEEMVLYYCAKPFHICRCCGSVYDLEPYGGIVAYSICPVCNWEEDNTAQDQYSAANHATLRDYRLAYKATE